MVISRPRSSNRSKPGVEKSRGRLLRSTRKSWPTPARRRSRRWSRKSNRTATARESGGSDGRLLSTSPRSSRSSSRPPSPTSPPTNRCMRLRIRTKKLRYTMEIVAVAFDSAFRKKLYPQVTLFQDLLGNRQRSRHGENAVWGLAVEVRGCGAEGFLGGAAAGRRAGDRGSAGGIPGHLDAEGRVRPETAVPGLLLA